MNKSTIPTDDKLTTYLNAVSTVSVRLKNLRHYYWQDLATLAKLIIPPQSSIIEFGCRDGYLLSHLPHRDKTGVEASQELVARAKKSHSRIRFVYAPNYSYQGKRTYDYILISNIFSYLSDVQSFVKKLQNISHSETRIIVIYFNFLWKPILDLITKLKLRVPPPFEPNWLSDSDIQNFFLLEGFELVKTDRQLLLPVEIPLLSTLVNRLFAHLPLSNALCLNNIAIFRSTPPRQEYSVSILIPARNEQGNIPGLLDKIPRLGTKMEVIFVEGHSRDNTYQAIQKEIARYQGPIRASLYKQKGIGKKDAMELAFQKMRNDLAIILDADLTVDPSELPKFYDALARGHGELAIGSRLVYPMERQAMRTLNYLGNKFFSLAFTFLLGQRIKDTLCGTKAILKSTYERIVRIKKLWGDIDPYGDFDLIFGASKLNLKIVEIPIRYRERTYGTTNISRLAHGLLLLRMTFFAAKKLKFT